MAFIRQNSAHTAVNRIVGPVAPRRRRVGYPLGAIQADPDLTRYTNGAPLHTLNGFITPPAGYLQRTNNGAALNGYESAPDLTQYTNGRPLPAVAGGNTPKAAIVLMAFDSAMSKRNGKGKRGGCNVVPMMSKHRSRGMQGLGDDTSGQVYSIDTVTGDVTSSPDISQSTVIPTGSSNAPPTSVWSESPSGSYGGGSLPVGYQMPTAAAPAAATVGNALTNLLSSLFRPAGSTVPAYYSAGSSLAQPIVAGSSISTGGALLLGGGALLLILLMKKR